MAYTSAEALCDRLGERADLFPAIWGQWMFRTGRSETEAARRLGTRLLAMAEKFGDSGLKIQAHHAMWSADQPETAISTRITIRLTAPKRQNSSSRQRRVNAHKQLRVNS